eukprot:739574-Prymnesium_polylepis.1
MHDLHAIPGCLAVTQLHRAVVKPCKCEVARLLKATVVACPHRAGVESQRCTTLTRCRRRPAR